MVKYIIKKEESSRKKVYIPVAAWTTSYGHQRIVEAAQAIRDWSMKEKGYDAWVYTDTDSLKVLGDENDLKEIAKFLEIDDYKLGAFACEEFYSRISCIRAKCYICEVDGMVHPTIAGLPKYLAPIINFENFKRGFTTVGMTESDLLELAKKNNASDEELEALHFKNTYVHCDGGVVLARTDFTIT